MEDEEEYGDENESESESDYDEEDEEEPQPKKARAKKKPTPAKKATAAKKKPAAKKPAKTRDDWIAQDYDGEAVDTAMEAKPVLDTKEEIWDAMLERFKFWMEKTNDPFPPQAIGYLGLWVKALRQRNKGKGGARALSKAEKAELIKAGFVFEGGREVNQARANKAAGPKWDAKFEQLKKFKLANDGREPKESEDSQLYGWCIVQRTAYRGFADVNGRTWRITPSQIERLKATGFDFTTGPGSGN